MPREQLAEALATIAAVVPDADGDDDAEWRVELVARTTARAWRTSSALSAWP